MRDPAFIQKLIEANEKALKDKDLGFFTRELTEASILRLKDELALAQLWVE